MKKYHTGYYLTLRSAKFTPKKYSNELISNPDLKLIQSNYRGIDWEITWEYNEEWHGLEFIICADTFEIAQNILFNVLCSTAVIEGTLILSNEAHHPFELRKNFNNLKNIDLATEPRRGFSSPNVTKYFYLAAQASKNHKIVNAIIKYHLSTEIYSQHDMDLHEVIDWKTTNYNYIQMRFAYAIVIAYSVIEELGIEKRGASLNNPSILPNGEWNPKIINDLINRLNVSGINCDEHIPWMIRGEETEIEKKRPIRIEKRAEWADPPGYENEFFITVNDDYVNLPDAINYVSFLRSSISSHRVGTRIFGLSVFDVANAQHLARRLILETMKMWK